MTTSVKAAGGFTLLECMVAILILNLCIAGMFRLVSRQGMEVDRVEQWLVTGQEFHLRPDADPLARALGKPALIGATDPSSIAPPEEGGYTVEVLERDQDITHNEVLAVFQMIPRREEKKQEKDERNQGRRRE